MRRRDGSIQSANLPAFSSLSKNRIDRDFGLYRCMVTRVHFVDDAENPTFENKQVTYEAIILGGPKEGQILQNVKALSNYGGKFNFDEHIFHPSTTKNFEELPISEQDGDIVFVQFLQGNTRAPVIIGAGVQPQDEDFTGSTQDDGFVSQSQYNGIFEEIDKNGNYVIRRKGGTLDPDSGVFVPDQQGDLASIELQDQKIIQKVGANIVSTVDGVAQTMVVTFAGGMTVSIDGKGDSLQIKSAAGGELNIVKDKIAIGNGTAELLQQISDTLQKMITFMDAQDSTHTHTGNLGYLTTPPTNASEFTALGSDLGTIKGLVDAIKGTL